MQGKRKALKSKEGGVTVREGEKELERGRGKQEECKVLENISREAAGITDYTGVCYTMLVSASTSIFWYTAEEDVQTKSEVNI